VPVRHEPASIPALAAGEQAGELLVEVAGVEVAGAEVTATLHVDNNGRGAKHVDRYRFDVRGSIEAGKIADFFLVPDDPLADIRAIRQVRLVVQAGRCYSPTHLQAALGIAPWTQPPPVRLGTEPVLPGG
jgi:hypothetical protein